MNNYITYDGKKYRTMFRSWRPGQPKAAANRINLDGSLDVTYAAATVYAWTGEIEAAVTPDDGTWGTPANLRASLAKRQSVVMIDHDGTSYNVHQIGMPTEESLSPMWDGASNVIYFGVNLVGEAV